MKKIFKTVVFVSCVFYFGAFPVLAADEAEVPDGVVSGAEVLSEESAPEDGTAEEAAAEETATDDGATADEAAVQEMEMATYRTQNRLLIVPECEVDGRLYRLELRQQGSSANFDVTFIEEEATGEMDPAARARYDSQHMTLTVPAVDVDGVVYNVTLVQRGASQNFELQTAEREGGSDLAPTFHTRSRLLVIPECDVDGVLYRLELRQRGASANFELSGVSEVEEGAASSAPGERPWYDSQHLTLTIPEVDVDGILYTVTMVQRGSSSNFEVFLAEEVSEDAADDDAAAVEEEAGEGETGAVEEADAGSTEEQGVGGGEETVNAPEAEAETAE